MLILGDTDPSLLRRSLMPGVPETAGKTVSARRSVIQPGSQAAIELGRRGTTRAAMEEVFQVKVLRYECKNTPLQGGISAFKSFKVLKTDSSVELLTNQRPTTGQRNIWKYINVYKKYI